MNKSICGANCEECLLKEKCMGCASSNGCPFGKECFIAKYIKIGGIENYYEYKAKLLEELNSLELEGIKKADELYPLCGSFVNLEYRLPSGEKVKFLDDREIYLGTQTESEFDSGVCYGLLAGADFLMAVKYGENGANPELLVYKKR